MVLRMPLQVSIDVRTIHFGLDVLFAGILHCIFDQYGGISFSPKGYRHIDIEQDKGILLPRVINIGCFIPYAELKPLGGLVQLYLDIFVRQGIRV